MTGREQIPRSCLFHLFKSFHCGSLKLKERDHKFNWKQLNGQCMFTFQIPSESLNNNKRRVTEEESMFCTCEDIYMNVSSEHMFKSPNVPIGG